MHAHTHSHAHPYHVVNLPGTTKTLLRQRVPASTNELVAMPIEFATLSNRVRARGGQKGHGSVLSCAVLLTALWNGTIVWIHTSLTRLSSPAVQASNQLELQVQKDVFPVELHRNGRIWGNGQCNNHSEIMLGNPHTHTIHPRCFVIVAFGCIHKVCSYSSG